MKDDVFIRGDVPMTKEEVRILTLDRLELNHASTFIDVGAGTGSICIEACVRYPNLKAVAIERNPEGIALIKQNCAKFGVENLHIIEGVAPLTIAVQSVDAIFLGGSGGSLKDIIDWSYDLLAANGRFVLNFILLDNLMEAMALLSAERFAEIEVNQLQVSRLTKLGKGHYFKPNNPTFIISCMKRAG